MLALAVLLVPIDVKLILKVRTRLVAREDTLPVVAVAPPVVWIARQHGSIASYCVETVANLKLELGGTG